MNIHVYNSQKDLKISAPSVKKAVHAALAFYCISCDELSIHFISERRICRMHCDYFNDPTPTDCISFPMDSPDEKNCFLGEVFVCPKTAKGYVEKNGGDPYIEVTLYVVHGLLHLIGYDDMTLHQRKTMKLHEKKIMTHLIELQQIVSP